MNTLQEKVKALANDLEALKLTGAQPSTPNNNVKDVLHEITEKQLRDRHAIVFNLLQSTATSTADQEKEDKLNLPNKMKTSKNIPDKEMRHSEKTKTHQGNTSVVHCNSQNSEK